MFIFIFPIYILYNFTSKAPIGYVEFQKKNQCFSVKRHVFSVPSLHHHDKDFSPIRASLLGGHKREALTEDCIFCSSFRTNSTFFWVVREASKAPLDLQDSLA